LASAALAGLGSGVGLVALGGFLAGAGGAPVSLAWGLPGARLDVAVDGLSALFSCRSSSSPVSERSMPRPTGRRRGTPGAPRLCAASMA